MRLLELVHDGKDVVELGGRGQDLDKFESGLELDLGFVEIGEGLFQMGLGVFEITSAFLGDPQECFDAPQPRLQLQRSEQGRDRVGKLVLKEEEYAEVGEVSDRELWPLLLEMLLDVLFERGNFLLRSLGRQDGHGPAAETILARSRLTCITYITIDAEADTPGPRARVPETDMIPESGQ